MVIDNTYHKKGRKTKIYTNSAWPINTWHGAGSRMLRQRAAKARIAEVRNLLGIAS
jgi:hypothetical protein